MEKGRLESTGVGRCEDGSFLCCKFGISQMGWALSPRPDVSSGVSPQDVGERIQSWGAPSMHQSGVWNNLVHLVSGRGQSHVDSRVDSA